MKKIIIFLVIASLAFSVCSCATVQRSIKFGKDQSEIVSVDIYYIEKQYYEGDIHNLRSENTPIYTFEPDVQNEFLSELESQTFEKEIVFLPLPMDGGCDYSGYIVSVVYTNGSYCIIAEQGQFYYLIEDDKTEKYEYDHSDYCGNESWSDFIEKSMREIKTTDS